MNGMKRNIPILDLSSYGEKEQFVDAAGDR